ncbi:transposase [Nitrosomonas sp.]|uniref:transposase n=1 Tax=Nitrosomonas sp. TaxID=42353 RepID=UPI0037CC3CAF
MRKHDLKFKHKVVQDYLSGKGGYKMLASKYGIAESMVRSWVSAYEHHGTSGLIRQRRQYTLEFKLEVLHRRIAENLSYRELGALYNIGNPHSITRWQQQYERGKLRGARCSSLLNEPMNGYQQHTQIHNSAMGENADRQIHIAASGTNW